MHDMRRSSVLVVLALLSVVSACGDPAPVTLEITATVERVADVNRVLATVRAFDASTGAPIHVAVVAHLAAGTDERTHAALEETAPGTYEAVFETSLGGPAAVVAEVADRDVVEVLALQLPTGPVDRFELIAGEPALPGEDLEVFVVALDANGNPVVGPETELVVRSELSFIREDTVCGEARLRVRSDAVGTFAVEVEDTVSGRVASADVVFVPAAVRAPERDPVVVAEGEAGAVAFPVDVLVPADWPTSRLTIDVTLDGEMVALATFEGASVDEEQSCVIVESAGVSELPDGTARLTVGLVRPTPFPSEGGGCIPLPRPRVRLAFALHSPGGVGERRGRITIDGVTGDANHPETGTPMAPIEVGFDPGRTYLCTTKTVYEGCIDYVRVRPTVMRGGMFVPPPSDADIQRAHDELNRTFSDSCIQLTAHIADITLDVPEMNQRITESRTEAGLAAVSAALQAEGLRHAGCMLVVLHDRVDPKGITLSFPPPDATSANAGTVLRSDILSNGRSLAHEIGHQLLLGGAHDRDADHLMTPTDRSGSSGGVGRLLTDDQSMMMQRSPWLTARTMSLYFVVR